MKDTHNFTISDILYVFIMAFPFLSNFMRDLEQKQPRKGHGNIAKTSSKSLLGLPHLCGLDHGPKPI